MWVISPPSSSLWQILAFLTKGSFFMVFIECQEHDDLMLSITMLMINKRLLNSNDNTSGIPSPPSLHLYSLSLIRSRRVYYSLCWVLCSSPFFLSLRASLPKNKKKLVNYSLSSCMTYFLLKNTHTYTKNNVGVQTTLGSTEYGQKTFFKILFVFHRKTDK